ncbi:MAG: sigma-54 dependent transcriptional regulator [Kangiellaceae bacterium]|nr:sigma-54 dependent transcriptional regulator [Kangiellaceae bacterium]
MNKQPLALIVDDEPDILQLLGITLSRMDIATHKAETLTAAKILLEEHQFDFCLTDMRLPDGDGIDLIKHIQHEFQQLPVSLIPAHGNMETAIESMKAGAFDFLSKPVDLTALRSLIKNALLLNTSTRASEDNEITSAIEISLGSKGLPANKTVPMKKQLIGDTKVMKQLKQTILKLARSQAPVYINGESGTGKELVAKLIHFKGPRGPRPFVPVNCGAIPSELMESEFFGHIKGSFTGAIADKKGLFQAAEGGTLFLDEVAELPMAMQVKLLRAIQEKNIRPVGSDKEIPVDIRILSASHRDLMELVNQGEFRQDLFYRINVIEIQVPALRERKADIKRLTEYLLSQLSSAHGLTNIKISDGAMALLAEYNYPGNIRELENILERALTLAGEDTIGSDDLNLPAPNAHAGFRSELPQRNGQALDDYMAQIEKDEILKALELAGGNRTKAAKQLGISFRAMRYKLEKLDISVE